jgi:hypothetical protein
MMHIVLVGIGAGAAAALLYASVASGSPLALFLAQLAPLPILIAAMGWSHLAGLIAAAAAAFTVGVLFGFFYLLVFLFSVALPAWWLGYLSLLARPVAANGSGTTLEWYPVGRLVYWAAIVAAMVVAAGVLMFGDKETLQATLRKAFDPPARILAPRLGLKSDDDIRRLVETLMLAAPPAAAILATILNSLNLWLAGRIVNVSGRLRRPWPDLPSLSLPPVASAVLAAAIVGSFLPDLIGVIALVLTFSLLMAYAIMGFAVLHAITRGIGGRGFVLAGAYAAVPILGWPVLAMSMLALAETAFDIRARFAAKAGPPATPT